MIPLPDLSSHINRFIEVRVHKSYVSRQNKAVRYRNFFGHDQYTSDSDVVCILQHSGQIRVPDFESEDQTYDGYSVIFKVLRSRPQYASQNRHNIKSRKASGFEGHSLKLESVCKIDWLGGEDELLQMAREMPTEFDRAHTRRIQKQSFKSQIALSKAGDTLYKALSDAKVFNLSLEVATQYNLCRFADRNNNEKTSDKLRTNVLYLETKKDRFEISRFTDEEHNQFYKLARVRDPFLKDDKFYRKTECLPLKEEFLEEVLADKLTWADLKWGADSLNYGDQGKIQYLANFSFRPIN